MQCVAVCVYIEECLSKGAAVYVVLKLMLSHVGTNCDKYVGCWVFVAMCVARCMLQCMLRCDN